MSGCSPRSGVDRACSNPARLSRLPGCCGRTGRCSGSSGSHPRAGGWSDDRIRRSVRATRRQRRSRSSTQPIGWRRSRRPRTRSSRTWSTQATNWPCWRPRSSKSFFFLSWRSHWQHGRDFLKWRISRPRRVVYVQFEVREHHTHRRRGTWRVRWGYGAADIDDRLHGHPGRGLGLKGADGLEQIRQAVGGLPARGHHAGPLYKTRGRRRERCRGLQGADERLRPARGADRGGHLFVHHDTKGLPGDKDIRDRGAG